MSFLEEQFGLQGKVAVVIGGTGTLCSVMAKSLAKAGANIVLAGRSSEKANKIIDEIGEKTIFIKTDLADKSSLESLLQGSLEKFGRVDIVINGAGVNSATPLLEIPSKEFSNILNINLGSILQASQVFGKYFLDNKVEGTFINLGSISGLNPLSRVFSYSASKAAVHNLTRNIAREWGKYGIRSNTLVPGFFLAEQNRKILDQGRIDSILNHTPMDKFGEPEELVGATLLLASQAGKFINGTEIIVDGGFNAMSI